MVTSPIGSQWSEMAYFSSSTVIRPVGQPVSPLVAAPGSDITLGCFFPHSETDNLYNLIVVWRRGDTEMVHSYKQQEDKLEKQSAAYRGRTRLYPDQLAAGNASLRLTGVQASDHGEYTCAGANEQGPFQMEIVLLVAAPYEEPQLAIQTTYDSIVLTFRSALGFPEPTVLWKIETGSDITNQSNTTLDLKDRVRYEVLSKMVLKPSDTQTVTFELMLGLLNQTFSRSVTLHPLPGRR
ncbi:hypothetical protein SKAU_G00417570 [Synaphobranchus kaupii]|uniref:Ig-like domain-containing protein n=1 Tax=Synaphobranchus kaupii TaxID=118154 RepID=A0A9Q1E611_SYNKA|nr:hypothetical protein SKAU_G00417570 [Synaphobranchus kaupii]